MNKQSLYAASVSLAVMSAVVLNVPVYAQSTSSISTTQSQETVIKFNIEHGTVKRGEAESVHHLETKEVPNGEYNVAVKSTNQSSVHPNSDIVVRSGDSTVVVEDVESEAFVESTAEGSLTVENGEVVVSVELGEDKVFSGGVEVTLTKVVTPEPTPAPVVPAKPEQTEVEEPKVEEPKVESAKDELPAEIPKTGPAAMLSGLAATSALGLGVHSWINSRRAVRRSIR